MLKTQDTSRKPLTLPKSQRRFKKPKQIQKTVHTSRKTKHFDKSKNTTPPENTKDLHKTESTSCCGWVSFFFFFFCFPASLDRYKSIFAKLLDIAFFGAIHPR